MAVTQLRARRPEQEQEQPGVVPPEGRRRAPLAIVALLVAAGAALLFAVMWTNAGEVLEPPDLAVMGVAADPQLRLVPAAELASVVGQVATSDLPAGSLLTRDQVGAGPALPAGSAVVGMSLTGGQVPTPTLRAGDRIRVVGTAGPRP